MEQYKSRCVYTRSEMTKEFRFQFRVKPRAVRGALSLLSEYVFSRLILAQKYFLW